VALHRDAAFLEPLVEPVEEYIAARLGDVENADCQTVEPLRPRQTRPYRRTSLRCRVEKHRHGLTSLVTGRLPRGPPADQPPMMPENIPASPPARTIISPPGRNLLTVLPASEGGPPSAMPLAPATSSSPGISHSRYNSSYSRALDQPASRKVRSCSGQTTSSASQAGASLTLWIAFSDSAMLRARLSGSRDFWSMTPCNPKPAKTVTAETPGLTPRSIANGSQHEPSSSSAKQ